VCSIILVVTFARKFEQGVQQSEHYLDFCRAPSSYVHEKKKRLRPKYRVLTDRPWEINLSERMFSLATQRRQGLETTESPRGHRLDEVQDFSKCKRARAWGGRLQVA